MNDEFIGGPSWSSTGWIAITTFPDYQIWKIKSNGDSLTQVTHDPGTHYYPVWSPDGKRIIFSYNSHARFIDPQGNLIHDMSDSVGFLGGNVWSADGRKIMAVNYCIDGNTYETAPTKYGGSIPWFPDSRHMLLWKEDGLYIWDIETDSEEKVKNHCSSKKYGSLAVSHDGKRIFASRTDSWVVDNTLHSESKIVMMDAYGNNEEVLPLE
jgi:Tol biopolymer transport system component